MLLLVLLLAAGMVVSWLLTSSAVLRLVHIPRLSWWWSRTVSILLSLFILSTTTMLLWLQQRQQQQQHLEEEESSSSGNKMYCSSSSSSSCNIVTTDCDTSITTSSNSGYPYHHHYYYPPSYGLVLQTIYSNIVPIALIGILSAITIYRREMSCNHCYYVHVATSSSTTAATTLEEDNNNNCTNTSRSHNDIDEKLVDDDIELLQKQHSRRLLTSSSTTTSLIRKRISGITHSPLVQYHRHLPKTSCSTSITASYEDDNNDVVAAYDDDSVMHIHPLEQQQYHLEHSDRQIMTQEKEEEEKEDQQQVRMPLNLLPIQRHQQQEGQQEKLSSNASMTKKAAATATPLLGLLPAIAIPKSTRLHEKQEEELVPVVLISDKDNNKDKDENNRNGTNNSQGKLEQSYYHSTCSMLTPWITLFWQQFGEYVPLEQWYSYYCDWGTIPPFTTTTTAAAAATTTTTNCHAHVLSSILQQHPQNIFAIVPSDTLIHLLCYLHPKDIVTFACTCTWNRRFVDGSDDDGKKENEISSSSSPPRICYNYHDNKRNTNHHHEEISQSLSSLLSMSSVSSSSWRLWKALWYRDYAWIVEQWDVGIEAATRSGIRVTSSYHDYHHPKQKPIHPLFGESITTVATTKTAVVSGILLSSFHFDKEFYFRFQLTWINYILAGQNTLERCLVGIGGHVYDLSLFLWSHPGSPETVLVQAGKDATYFFDGINHSMGARRLAQTLCIIVDQTKTSSSSTVNHTTNNNISNNHNTPISMINRPCGIRPTAYWFQQQQKVDETARTNPMNSKGLPAAVDPPLTFHQHGQSTGTVSTIVSTATVSKHESLSTLQAIKDAIQHETIRCQERVSKRVQRLVYAHYRRDRAMSTSTTGRTHAAAAALSSTSTSGSRSSNSTLPQPLGDCTVYYDPFCRQWKAWYTSTTFETIFVESLD